MSIDSAKPFIKQAQDAVASLTTALTSAMKELGSTPVQPPPPSPTTTKISTAADFDRALTAAKPGDVLLLASTLIYPAPLTLRTPITLQSETYANTKGIQARPDEQAPSFMGGLDASGDDVRGLYP